MDGSIPGPYPEDGEEGHQEIAIGGLIFCL